MDFQNLAVKKDDKTFFTLINLTLFRSCRYTTVLYLCDSYAVVNNVHKALV